jgi:hypothetical protein
LASVRRFWAAGESMTASTAPLATVEPGSAASEAMVPSAGAVSVATARAVTDAGTSTTSTTVAVRTVSRAIPVSEDVQAAAVRLTAATKATSRGVRRTRRSLLTRRGGLPGAAVVSRPICG